MVVFGQEDLWSLGVSPSDKHREAENLSLSIAIIRSQPVDHSGCVSVMLLQFL